MALDRNGGATGTGAPVTTPDAPADGTLYGRINNDWQEALTPAEFDAHLADAADAHAASAVTFTPTGTLSSTTVQAAIAELEADVVAGSGLAGHLADAVDAHDASAISFTPVGTIAATDVQGAIAEVAAEASATTVATDTIFDAKGDLVAGTGANAAARVAVGTDGYVLTADSAQSSGVAWNEPGTTSAPTVTKLTSGSGTYTKPAGCTRIVVKMVGGGGGGGGSGTSASAGAGGNGGSTTFGLHTAAGGTGGVGAANAAGGAGGSATIGAGAVGVAVAGGEGDGNHVHGVTGTSSIMIGGRGGLAAYFGGGASRGYTPAAVANTGGGGAGGATNGTNLAPGAGGGAGGFLDLVISAPAASYSYAVGAAGTAGTLGTSGAAGTAGAAGQIYITEYYGNFDSVLQLNEPASTKQRFTSGSGTYTTPAGVNRIRVKMVGGGSGGGTSSGASSAGGTSTFGTSLLTCNGGAACSPPGSYAAFGGSATISAPAVGIAVVGGAGHYTNVTQASSGTAGGQGGDAPYFGGGGPSAGGVAGVVGSANTGGGGGGGGTSAVVPNGNGGASGGFIDAWIWNPSATYAYAVGAGSNGGAAGTSGFAGGNGAAGVIEVEEFYGPTNTVADTQPLSGWPGRNRIINGDMRIDQRNAGAAVTADGSFPVDRWSLLKSGTGTLTVQRGTTTPPAGFTHYIRATATVADTSAAAEYYGIGQRIEGNNITDLDFGLSTAKTVTVSFWVRSSLTGTFSVSIRNSATNRAYIGTYTISTANTWERKTVSIAGDTSGTWLTDTGVGINLLFDLGSGSTYQSAAGAWAATNTFAATGQTAFMATGSATLDLTGVQLEPGSVRTEFERESYSVQLAKCQRYYHKHTTTGTFKTFATAYVETATTAFGHYSFPVSMRTAPTLETTGVAANYCVTTSGANTNCSIVPSVNSAEVSGAALLFTVASGLTGNAAGLLRNPTSGAYLAFAAEL